MKRIVVWAAVFISACLLASVVWLICRMPHGQTRVTFSNLKRIQRGMVAEEADTILGVGEDIEGGRRKWVGNGMTIIVALKDGRVVGIMSSGSSGELLETAGHVADRIVPRSPPPFPPAPAAGEFGPGTPRPPD